MQWRMTVGARAARALARAQRDSVGCDVRVRGARTYVLIVERGVKFGGTVSVTRWGLPQERFSANE